MFEKPIVHINLTLFVALSFCSAKLPPGTSFNEQAGLRLSPQVARILNVETQCLDRQRYITKYVAALESPDPGERAWAAYALGAFQDELALRVLIQRTSVETSEPVVDEMYTLLNGIFELYGFPAPVASGKIAVSKARARAREWMQTYTQLGYAGLAKHGWEMAKKRGTDGISLFLAQLTARYDPTLTPLLVEILNSPDAAARKDQIETTVLSWSGYDPRTANLSELKKELAAGDAFTSDKICARYRSYFETIGYADSNYSNREIGLAVLFGETDKKTSYRRDMALRMLSFAD